MRNGVVNALRLRPLVAQARPSPPEITPPITPHSSMSSASSVPSPVSFSHGLQSPISSRRRGAVSVGPSHSSPDFAYDTPSDFQRSARVPLIQTPTWPLTTEQDQLYQHHWAQCGEVPPTSWAPPGQFTNAGYTQHGAAAPQENAPYEPNQQPDSMFSESFNTLSTHSFNPPVDAPFQDDAPNLAGQCFNSSATQLHYDTSPLTSYVANPTPGALSFTTRDPDPGTPVPSNPRYFPPAVHSHYSEHLPDVGDNAPFQDTPFYNSGSWTTQPSGFVQNNNCASHVSHDGHGGSGPYAWDGQRRSSLATLTFFHPTE